jgi:hypothetical protein
LRYAVPVQLRQSDLARIAFVTRRFDALQGLGAVSYGAALIVGVLAYEVLPRELNPVQYFISAQILAGAAAVPIQRYYRRVFGNVSRGDRFEVAGRPRSLTPGVVVPSLVMMGLFLDLLNGGRLGTAASIGAAVLTVASLRTTVQDWPHRCHHVIAVFAGAVALVVTASGPTEHREIWQPMSEALVGYYMVACAIVGFALVATGLLDHHLLAQSFFGRATRVPGAPHTAEYFAEPRISMAGAVCLSLVAFLAVRGWPSTPTSAVALSMLIWLPLMAVMVLAGWRDAMWGLDAFKEAAQAREAKLKAFVAARLANASPDSLEVPDALPRSPPPDTIGHLVLPLAMAGGALVDIACRPNGLPSMLAFALCLSHARIAWRDWPARKHYVVGASAAAVCAVLHMFIGIITPLDWTVGFLLLVSGAMSIEGWCDRRLERVATSDNAGSRHADTI